MPLPAPTDPDDEPIILLDTAAEVEALMPASADNLLTELADRSSAALATDIVAQDLLRSAGIPNPTVWTSYRLGAPLPATLDPATRAQAKALGLIKRAAGFLLAGQGINVPTIDPRDPSRVVGIIRLKPSQFQHNWATEPAGFACPINISPASRVVLADGLIIGLRLAQAGVPHVAIVESPEVLPPLLDWCSQRELIIAGYRRERIQAIRDALGDAGARATVAVVSYDLAQSPETSLTLLGADRHAIRPSAPPIELTPIMLRDLHRYARERVEAGEAADALRILEADVPDLVTVYDIGFLPSTYLDAMPADVRSALRGDRLGGHVVLPARDAQGTIVDLLAVHAHALAHATSRFLEPRGMLGGSIGTACSELLVTDYLRGLGRLFRDGHRNVLLLRDAADARLHADRLLAAGVTAVELHVAREAAEISEALRGVGIKVGIKRRTGNRWPMAPTKPMQEPAQVEQVRPNAVEEELSAVEVKEPPVAAANPVIAFPKPPPESPQVSAPQPELLAAPARQPEPQPVPTSVTIPIEPLELVQHDRQAELATFKAGLTVYVIEVPWDTEAKLEVTLRHAVSPLHRDRFDLASEAARSRFASAAPLRCGLPSQVVEVHLLDLLDQVRALQRKADPLAQPSRIEVLGAERDAAMALLTAPDLLDRLMADLDALGWAGEADTKQALYLASISRLLPEPLWVVRLATQGSGKSFGIQTIADLTPPEDLIQVSLLTDRALYHQDEHALRHKMLVIDESDALSDENITALRTLKTRGALSMRQALPPGSAQRSRQVDAHGPVALLTSTAGRLDDQLQSRCLLVPVDESPAQTIRIVSAQSRLAANPRSASTSSSRVTILQRHRNLQRLLAHREVAIPYAERIDFPTSSVRHRRGFLQFLGLIRASALLHQHQRLSDHGQVAADERDFAIAARLADAMGIADEVEMGRGARQLLTAVQAARPASFTIADARGFLPLGTAYAVRKAVTELEQLGLVEGPAGGRGTTGTFRLSPAAIHGPRRIRLLAVGEVRETARELTTPIQNVG